MKRRFVIGPAAVRGIGAGYVGIGAVLCYFGYLHT
jgi:hypothetical protein